MNRPEMFAPLCRSSSIGDTRFSCVLRMPAMVPSEDQTAQPEFPAIRLSVDSNVRQ
jgi:hypothetical protein